MDNIQHMPADGITLVPTKHAYSQTSALDVVTEFHHIQECLSYGFPKVEQLPLTDEWINIVGFGPSLHDTWQDIQGSFITVSGAHDFMIGHGRIPKWHIECDGREHKTKHLQHPHKDVCYVMATLCHPTMWKLLQGYNVKTYYIANGNHTLMWIGVKDPDSMLVAGGSTVGTTAIHLAGLFGYRKFRLYGFDGNFRGEVRHAGTHYGPEQRRVTRIANGKTWETTPQMHNACDELLALTNNKDLTFEIYGDSLMRDILIDDMYNAKLWNRIEQSSRKETLSEIVELDSIVQPLRTKANFNTGTISNSSAVILRNLTEYFKPNTIVEIGTFIGKSTLSMRANKIYTCDKDNDCVQSTDVIQCFPYTTSTDMLGRLVDSGIKCDMFFFDGRIQDVDLPLILRLSNKGETIYVFDDYEGQEKGVVNVGRLREFLTEYNLVKYPSVYNSNENVSLALLIPKRLV